MSQIVNISDLCKLQPGQIIGTSSRYLLITRREDWYVVVNTLLKTKRYYTSPLDVFRVVAEDVQYAS